MVPAHRTDGVATDGSVVENASDDYGLDRIIQSRIGEQLRAMYDGLMEQPVPDRFHALLARLEGSGGRKDQG